MSRWSDIATWRGATVNEGDGDGKPLETADALRSCRGLVVHIAEGTFEGTIAWQRNAAADVSSHFIVAKDGRIAQMVDTLDRAWTQRDGNSDWLSVEMEGHTPSPLTPQQIEACAKLLLRGHQEKGYPLIIARSPVGSGLGHHSMGAENGYNWGHSSCPGPNIIAQKATIVALAIKLKEGNSMTPAEQKELINTFLKTELNSPGLNHSAPIGDWLKGGWDAAEEARRLSAQVAILQRTVTELKQLVLAMVPGDASGLLERMASADEAHATALRTTPAPTQP